ncbi:MAG: tryptophanyl-tRNA synthetase [Frankiaceae bacterium]|nr:tryptophanyl-tRNA synthetase [Frankiaceae bacterium]
MTAPTPAPDRRRILSGIQPTADSFHLGNYLGAVSRWVPMQDSADAFYMIADLHAITVEQDPAVLRHRTRVAAAQLLAVGLDPAKCTLFVQSQVPEHAELAWILGCLTGFGEAGRMTQFKDKSSKVGAERASVGLFTYPVLQAADILLYRANAVPVGEDQRQHLELTRVLAQRFNARYGPTLTVPEPEMVKGIAKIFDLQNPTAKMSKSADSQAGVIDLLEDPKSLRKKVRSAVTDSGHEVAIDPENKPGVTNLLVIYSALTGRSMEDIAAQYGDSGYGGLKVDLAEVVVEWATPIQERTRAYLEDPAALDSVLAAGARRAREVAAATMADVRERTGFLVGTSLMGTA